MVGAMGACGGGAEPPGGVAMDCAGARTTAGRRCNVVTQSVGVTKVSLAWVSRCAAPPGSMSVQDEERLLAPDAAKAPEEGA